MTTTSKVDYLGGSNDLGEPPERASDVITASLEFSAGSDDGSSCVEVFQDTESTVVLQEVDYSGPVVNPGGGLKPFYTTSQIVDRLTNFGTTAAPIRRKWTATFDPLYPVVTFGINTTAPTNFTFYGLPASSEAAGMVSMSAVQIATARLSFQLWDDLIPLTLVESGGAAAKITLNYSSVTIGGGTYSSAAAGGGSLAADQIWLASQWVTNADSGMVLGGYGLQTMLHEIGHSLGLAHAGPYNSTADYASQAEFAQDSRRNTIMSYFDGYYPLANAWSTGTYINYLYSQTPMVYDIAAIQSLYGADYTTRSGDTVYGYNSNLSALDPEAAIYDFSTNVVPIFTIWDGGGVDTLDSSQWSGSQVIDLNPGNYSSVRGMNENVAIALNAWVENAVGGDGADSLFGSVIGNQLSGNGGDDTIYGNAGDDLLNGGDGNDWIDGGANNDTIYGGGPWWAGGADIIFGGDGDDFIDGGGGSDLIDGGLGNDTIQAGDAPGIYTSADTLIGGDGDDQLQAFRGNNLLQGGKGNDVLMGGENADVLEGGDDDDALQGGGGNDLLYGGKGNDGLRGDAGSDSLFGGEGDDFLQGGYDGSLLDGGSGADSLVGYYGADTLYGGDGNDTLAGWFGPDTMVGGLDDDQYYVDYEDDVVTELAGEGHDTVFVLELQDYTLADNVEDLTLLVDIEGSIALNGKGNALNNVITGNLGDNTLDGAGGADTMIGGLGNDTYYVDQVDDVVTELADEGTDTVIATVDYAMGANIEVLTLLGGAVMAMGNAFDNSIAGNALDNTLDGGAGADTMAGGAGNDTYIVDNVQDIVLENASEGTDLVKSSVTYTLYANVENLTLTGTAAIDAWGNELNNLLVGNTADNTLLGLGGADTMIGGLGNDTYWVDNAGDVVVENAGEGTDRVNSTVNYTLGSNVENLSLFGSAVVATGNVLDNIIGGNDLDNLIDGGAGADSLGGGAGDDTYIVDNVQDIVLENASEGTDLVKSSVTYTLYANVENLTLTGTAAIDAWGNELNNLLIGNTADNTLLALGGADTMIGGLGNDTYWVDNAGDVVVENAGEGTDRVNSTVNYTLGSNVENLSLFGGAVVATGNALGNIIGGNDLDNLIDGGAGADSLGGGAGDDTYIVDNVQDIVLENASEGTDLVKSSVTYTLYANVENLTLTGNAAISGTGNTLANLITGNAAANTLDGGSGSDTLVGGAGNDIYIVDNAADVVTENVGEGTDLVKSSVACMLSANVENLMLTGSAAINGTGNTLANLITGNAAANTLDGGLGADTLIGGVGDDIYIVDNAVDVVTENAGEGADLVQASVTYTLANNVENLTLTGSGALNGTGNTLDNLLTGNSGINKLTGAAGNDTLDGGAGADSLIGGVGDDTYIIDNTGDTVTENASEGTDLIKSSLTWTLGSNIENLTLTGTSAINGTGNTLANILTGNSAANTLDGGTGVDSLIGGAGNDTYIVDNVGDVVTENASEGVDLVKASVTYTLGNNVENLTLTGSSALNGTGNTLDNLLTGNSGINKLTGAAGNDTLDGGAGADSLIGGLGNDTYLVDNTGDVITENASEGTDLVQASVTYTLASNVENLTLTGSSALNGTGNTLDNVLTGNSGVNKLTGAAGNDTLDGGTGADSLIGGVGDDTYIVDNTGDVVTENTSEGTDLIKSSLSWTLGANLENLTLTGTSAINGTGNTLANLLTGNAAANTLTGDAGNDTLDGGAGNDSLVGGTGNDTYLLGRGYGTDTLTENDSTSGNTDVLKAASDVAANQLWFVKNGNNLEVSIIGTSDKEIIANWYLGNQYHVEQFKSGDGKTLLDSKVANLVSAMAAFAPPGAGQTTLPASYQSSLNTVIAANWQ